MKKIISLSLLLTGIMIVVSGWHYNSNVPTYKNPELTVEKRTKDLLSRMTIEEKVAQMTCLIRIYDYVDSLGSIDSPFLKNSHHHGIGQISDYTIRWRKPEILIAFQNNLQYFLINRTRLGIPAIIHSEGTRSAMFNGATMFPAAIALAGSWDLELIKKVNRVIAQESRARGIQQVEAPVVDVAREPRWGRIEETFGEDPYLVSQIGIQAVKGLQGENGNIDSTHVIATLKHFAAYSQPERGLNGAANNCSERILREVFFPPFKEALQKGGALSVMASYNEIDGIPSTVNRWLLTDVLRNEWGFKGTVVTDYGCFRGDMNDHRISADSSEIARLACSAGVNIEFPQPYFYPQLIELVHRGIIHESKIDEMVYPILEQKFRLGLFDHPYIVPDRLQSIMKKVTSSNLALDAARKSIILLKNTDGFCPLERSKIKTIAIIGPHADSKIWGNVTMEPRNFITVCEGVRNKVGEKVRVLSSEGCKITVFKNKKIIAAG
jgi:beta-glucosidase